MNNKRNDMYNWILKDAGVSLIFYIFVEDNVELYNFEGKNDTF